MHGAQANQQMCMIRNTSDRQWNVIQTFNNATKIGM
jgi:hypothetical protein